MNAKVENNNNNNNDSKLKSLNYCFLLPSSKFEELEIQTLKRAADCTNNGHKSLLVISPNTKLSEILKNSNQKFQLINVNLNYIDVFSAYRLAKIYKRNNIDICVVPQSKSLSLALMSRYIYYKLYKKDIAIIFYQQTQSKIDKKDFFHNLIYKNIDGAITLTKIMSQDLVNTTNIVPEKITTIAYGIDTQSFHPSNFDKTKCRELFNLPVDKFLIGNISKIEKHKDQITSIKAFKEANLHNAVLVFCGEIIEPTYKNEIDILIDEIGETDKEFSKKIIFIDYSKISANSNSSANREASLLNALDIYMMSSRSQAFGIMNIKALASGLPVLATSSGGVPEIIKDSYNGLLFTREDFLEASRKLKLLYKSPELRDKLSENSLNDVKNKYDYKTQTDKFFEFCELIYNKRINIEN